MQKEAEQEDQKQEAEPTLKDLLTFPCQFAFKVVGYAKPELPSLVISVVQRHAPGDYTPTVTPSGKGTYNAVSIKITATSIEQVEILYKELAAIDIVRLVL